MSGAGSLRTAAIDLPPSSDEQGGSAVAFDGANYVAAWVEFASDPTAPVDTCSAPGPVPVSV